MALQSAGKFGNTVPQDNANHRLYTVDKLNLPKEISMKKTENTNKFLFVMYDKI